MDGIFLKVLKRVLIPAATVVAEATLSQENQENCLCRPSELPIYQPESASQIQQIQCEQEESPKAIEYVFSTARTSFTKVLSEVEAYKRVGQDYLVESKDNAEWLLKYLRQEDNMTPKAGAIAIGGLTGFILGLRGGMIRRTFYASIGALGMASVCYPQEAAEYSQIGLTEAKKYLKIAYNFAYGVKKDDPPLELPTLPKLPTSFSEAWQTVSKSASSLVSGEAEPEIEEEVILEIDEDDESLLDPLAVVSQAHDQASESCHCPIGACLGQHDDGLAPDENISLVDDPDTLEKKK